MLQAKVSRQSPLPRQATKLGARHTKQISPSCCPHLSCLALGRAHSPCLPGLLPPLPVLLRCCKTEMLSHCQRSHVPKEENKSAPSCKGWSESITPTEDTQEGGVTCPLCSLAWIRPEDTQAGHGASLQLQPPAFLLAGGNCSARNFHAALQWQSCHQSRRARGCWPSGSTTSSPRPTCCSERGHGPDPLCRGAGVLPPRLRSAPGNRSRKGMLGQERAAWLGPDDTGMDACPRLASPCPSSCLL